MSNDRACIVIPARHASSRYPGKPLVTLRGANGVARSLLERTVIAARRAAEAAADPLPILVATDDDRIAAEAARIGVAMVMTGSDCRNGTERVAQAVERAGIDAGIVINLQGDAPLTPPHFITRLIAAMRDQPETGVATPVLRCDGETLANLLADRAAGRVGATTVVSNRLDQALYFSKEVIPFSDALAGQTGRTPVFHHVGVYAYRPAALTAYRSWEPGELEQIEGLEQLRFLEHGHPVRTVEVTAPGASFWELNNPSDVPLIEGYLARMGWD